MIDRAVLRPAAVLALIGAALGAGVALLVHHVQDRTAGDVAYHGSYVPLNGSETSRSYASTLSVVYDRTGPHLWSLLGICVGTGLAAGLLVVLGLRLAGRRIALVSAASPSGPAPR